MASLTLLTLFTLLSACDTKDSATTDDTTTDESAHQHGDDCTQDCPHGSTGDDPVDTGPGVTSPPDGDAADLWIPPGGAHEGDVFSTAHTCATCHSNDDGADAMRDAEAREIGMQDLWQGTMMANSARDPLWRAAVAAEVAATPDAAAAIEAKCTRCHAPMGSEDAARSGETLALATLREDSDRGDLSRDGVSCTLCHQVGDENFGEESSFGGNYLIPGDGRIYGPHDDPHDHPMEQHTNYTPVSSQHVMESALCATCHTLETHSLDASGGATGGTVMEQAPYLEWLASDFSRGAAESAQSCQDCHLPTADEDDRRISVAIARSPGGHDMGSIGDRSPYGRHVLVGGNTLVPQMLRDWPDVLNPEADAAAFDAVIASARAQLKVAGSVSVETSRAGETLDVTVNVANLSGHKLPSGIPTRRAWLRVVVRDASGAAVFASGEVNDAGAIVDAAGEPLASELAGGPLQPHRDVIDASDQAQVYEAVLADGAGAPTWTLMRGEGWAKDTRLLPLGWRDPDPRIVPVGAEGDANFSGGGDVVHYAAALAGSEGPWEVSVSLLYQPLSTRHAAELFTAGIPETEALRVMWEAADRAAEVIDSESLEVL